MTGLWRDEAHRYYVSANLDAEQIAVEVGPLPSVTTILRALDKSGPLVGWATRETAAAAIRNLDVLQRMVAETGAASAQSWLQKKPGYIKDTAADIGSRTHALAEDLAAGRAIAPEDAANPKVQQYVRFLEDWQPEFVGIEQMVVNFTHGYAGTADIFARMAGQLWLLDIKTGKGTYPDMALQLAGLNLGEWWGAPDNPDLTPALHADRFGILHLQDNGYSLLEYGVTAWEYETFLAIKRTHDWLEKRAGAVVLGPLAATDEGDEDA